MIFLRKKRIYILLSYLAMFILLFEIKTAKIESENTVETVALPSSGKVIVIDARTWISR